MQSSFLPWISPVILAGDYNIIPNERDVYSLDRWRDDALFLPQVRTAYASLLKQGWCDAIATIERLNEEFRRRIKTQTVLPCAETVPMLLWALLASGQIQMRKVDGWETLSQPIEPMPLDLAA
jgi:hypothetical protein